MNDTWSIKLITRDGEVRYFKALSCYEPTPEHKLLWKTVTGEEKITSTRVRAIFERKERDEISGF